MQKYEMIGAEDDSDDCLLSLKYVGYNPPIADGITMDVEIDVRKIVFHLMM